MFFVPLYASCPQGTKQNLVQRQQRAVVSDDRAWFFSIFRELHYIETAIFVQLGYHLYMQRYSK